MNNCHSLVRKKKKKEQFLLMSFAFYIEHSSEKNSTTKSDICPFLLLFFPLKKKRILTFPFSFFFFLLLLPIAFNQFYLIFFPPLFLFKKNLIKVFHKISILYSYIEKRRKKRERNKTVSLLIDYLTWLLKHVLLRREREREKKSSVIIIIIVFSTSSDLFLPFWSAKFLLSWH